MCNLHLVLGDKQIRRQDWDNRPLPGKERRKGGTGHTAEPRLPPQDRVFLKSGSWGEWAWEDHGQRLRGREKRLWNGQTKLGRRSWKNGSSESKSGISKEWRRGCQGLGKIWAPRHPGLLGRAVYTRQLMWQMGYLANQTFVILFPANWLLANWFFFPPNTIILKERSYRGL